jgi:uncharacterized delta-60 repeat protein
MRTKLIVSLTVFITGLFFSSMAFGAMDLDIGTFNQPNGFAVLSSGSDESGYAIAVQSDGKVVVAGNFFNGLNYDVLVLRFSTIGTLDTTFGNAGIVTYDGGGDEYGSSLAVQSDGKIVVTGGMYDERAGTRVFILRLNTNGTVDTTFGTGGIVTSTFGVYAYVSGLAIQRDGKIVVAGSSYDGTTDNVLVFRVSRSGLPDSTFGAGGTVLYDTGSNEYANALALQPDGKIVVAGNLCDGMTNEVLVLRLNSNGSLDSTFGTGGAVRVGIGTNDSGEGLAIQSDGKIVVSGVTFNGLNNDVLLLRLNVNGTPDSSFGAGGVVTYDGGYDEYGDAVTVQSDGKIVVVGSSFLDGTDYDGLLLRFSSAGRLDSTFGTQSLLDTEAFFSAVAIQPDGKIVVVGSSYNGLTYDVVVLRVKGTERPDIVVSALSASAIGSVNGQGSLTVTFKVKNQGTTGAAASTIKFYLSRDAVLSAADLSLGSAAVTALSAGSETAGTASFAVSAAATGAWYVIGVGDANNVVQESDETNNMKTALVAVR